MKYDPGPTARPIEREVYTSPEQAASPWACTTSTTSIRDFARASFNYGLPQLPGLPVDQEHHPQVQYDGRFKDIFQHDLRQAEFKAEFDKLQV